MQKTTLRDAAGLEIMGVGLHWDDVQVGDRFRTLGRTITETDIVAYVAAVGMVEEMFTNIEYIREASIMGVRPVPGSLVFCIAEGLLMQSTMQRTGMAFFEADIKVHKPSTAGDTIHVECEVVQACATSKPERGLLRTSNKVINQRGEVVLSYNPLRMVKSRPAA